MSTPGDEVPLQSLGIYLIKDDVASMGDVVQSRRGVRQIDLSAELKVPALLLIRRPAPHSPTWARFFDGAVDLAEFGRVSSSAALLVLSIDGRMVALTFGQGRYLLDLGKIEERFGLKVCLNSIDERAIRSIDKRSLDALLAQSRVQPSRAAAIGDFGLDIEQDLLRGATGKPKAPELGERMSGLDSLHVSVRTALPHLVDLLPKYLAALRSTRFRKTFPWVEQIAEIRNPAERARLDSQLIDRLCGNDESGLWMAIPDVVDWSVVHGFRYSHRRDAPLHYDIHIDEWLSDINAVDGLTIEEIDRKRVYASDTEGKDILHWPAYRCLYCEIEQGGTTFLLNGGSWFRIKKDLVDRVNETYACIPRRKAAMPVYSHESEGEYNLATAAAQPDAYSCHDKKNIKVPGSGSPIEVCDLYGRGGELFHVKRYGASSVLSHLFAQAVVSAEALSLDEVARTEFAKQMKKPFEFAVHDFKASNHAIVLAIVSDQEGDLHLPFFSRLNLRNAWRRLQSMGFEVQIAKIDVDDRVKKRKTHLPQKVKR